MKAKTIPKTKKAKTPEAPVAWVPPSLASVKKLVTPPPWEYRKGEIKGFGSAPVASVHGRTPAEQTTNGRILAESFSMLVILYALSTVTEEQTLAWWRGRATAILERITK